MQFGFLTLGKLGVNLGGVNNSVGPTAPVLSMDASWDTSQATPIFDIDAAWADQDDLQFEIQTAAGNWSGATVTHHTVTTSEISGVQISFSIGPLTNANYEARCKFKHFGGTYSSYSTGTGPSGGLAFTINVVSSNFTATYISSAAQ